MSNLRWVIHRALIISALLGIAPHAFGAGLRVETDDDDASPRPIVRDGDTTIFIPIPATGGLRIVRPDGVVDVAYESVSEDDGNVTFRSESVPDMRVTDTFTLLGPDLVARTVTVQAHADLRCYLDFGWHADVPGDFRSFMGKEPATAAYTPGCGGPEFGGQSMQTFPFLGVVSGDTVYGVIGDTPGLWENRSFMKFDLENRNLSLTNGDGSAKRVVSIPRELDATTVYRATFDGWQHLEAGDSKSWTTWILTCPVKSQYDVQLAAHLALANAKGFNGSGLEAILRNTSYLLLRRNLLRPESDYIFISGVGYGWKQWVTDGFYMSRGLDDPVIDTSAHNAVFYDRISYEDNAQYYLIWSVLVKRAGGDVDTRTVDRAYRFMRAHEHDGLYIAPRLKPDQKNFKTYHDLLEYDDDDAPSSNQGFHCGALYAARELGYEIAGEEIDRAIQGYRRMFNADGGYLATSLKQQNHIGQDSLYGEVLTFCVFGEKLLPDDFVRTHLETTMRVQSPYGMRVISEANGDLLEGHGGSYVFGGSWFLNDGANYLCGLIHGMDPAWVDEKLLWRLEKELAFMPAFHESINTLTGAPHGHHLYSWNSGFWWLRREVRRRLGMDGADPLDAALDERLGVVRSNGLLSLDPDAATLRPNE